MGANGLDARVSVSVRGLLLTGLVLLGLLAAYLVGAAGRPGPTASASEETAAASDRRTLALTGVGEASAVPDQLSFRLAVSQTRPRLEVALAESSRTMRRVLRALEEFGVEGENVQTTGLSMDPVYVYDDDEPPRLTGYRVAQRARVVVPELADGGRAVTAAVAAGGNSVRASSIQLEVSDPEGVLAEARDAAVADATRKAEAYAVASGQALGAVMSLREVPAGGSADQTLLEAATRDVVTSRTSAPIRAGEEELSVTVAVVWEFA